MTTQVHPTVLPKEYKNLVLKMTRVSAGLFFYFGGKGLASDAMLDQVVSGTQ